MKFNYKREKERFFREHAKMAEEYRAAGMTEEDIEELFQWDWELFKEERRYIEHRQDLRTLADNSEDVESWNSLMMSNLEKFSEEARYFSGELTSCMETIDSRSIYKVMKKLGKQQWTILYLYAVYDMSQAEIAYILGISQSAVSQRLETIRKKFKKFCE